MLNDEALRARAKPDPSVSEARVYGVDTFNFVGVASSAYMVPEYGIAP